MSGKKSSRGAMSNISTAASPNVSSSISKKSSILRSSFAPSEFQLALFASVIQGFDSQQLRIHDTNSGRLRCDYSVGAAAQINSLDWGYFGSSQQQRQNKKRKRQQSNTTNEEFAPEQAVIALATSEADIRLFSPSEDEVVATLKGGHDRDVKAFKFTASTYTEGWSIGGDAKLVQWDVKAQRATRTISLPNNAISVLAQPALRAPQILCASSIPYAVTLVDGSSQDIVHFDAFRNPIHSILRSSMAEEGDNETFLAADSDRYINLYDITEQRLAKTLVAEFGVESIVSSNGSEVVAAITNNGLIQLFQSPFAVPSDSKSSAAGKKAKRHGPSRPSATVRLMHPGNSTPTPIHSASFDGKHLVVVWVESGVSLAFERIKWQVEDSSNLAFEGTKDIIRGKSSSLLNSVTTNGVHDVGRTFVDDSQVVVTAGGDVHVNGDAAISHEDDGAEDRNQEEDVESMDDESERDEPAKQLTQGDAATSEDDENEEGSDAEMADAAPETESDEEAPATEPSFGELLASKHPEPIAISTLAQTKPSTTPSTLQSGLSLTTVLSQALTTSDNQLLESCLHTTDPNVIRLTIQRLPSNLAASLLSKLADRLSRRPGRYGHLLIWVQWTCVAHGGAIAGRKDILSKVQSLFKVLNQRAKSLDNLLLLKGKLDMLDAQIGLRKQMAAERRQQQQEHGTNNSLDDIDDEDIIYIEGQNEDSGSSSASSDEEPSSSTHNKKRNPRKSLHDLIADDDDDAAHMGLTNGIASISASEDDIENDDDDADLIDSQASESSAEGSAASEDEEEEEEDSEMDSFINDGSISEVEDEEEEEVEEMPPVKKTKGKGKGKGVVR